MPHPSGRLPILGDVLRLSPSTPVQGEMRMAQDLGSIFEIKIVSDHLVVVAGADIAAEIFDEARFAKAIVPPLTKVRQIAKDGLFTAYNSEPNWAKAHNVLAPAFSQASMRSYHDTMIECVTDLVGYWDKAIAGSSRGRVEVPGDMNKLTLEIIGRTGFGYEFHSFDAAETDPFVNSMSRALGYVSSSANDIPILREILGYAAARQFPKDVKLLQSVVDDVIAARRQGGVPEQNTDLLQRMIDTPDPDTGELLDDENIRYQVLTFLVAGHETTAGVLSFALHYLSINPHVLREARAEIDQVWTDRDQPITFEQVAKFRYVRRVIDETLRLWPSGPAFFRKARKDTVVGGKYLLKKGHPILVVLLALHRDPAVWGPDPDRFDPDRFLPSEVKARQHHSNAYKPFGTGARACVGRQFALHEAVLALVMLVDKFDFAPDADYQLKVKELLTIRPDGLELTLTHRPAA
ncbi:cytochrome P450 [Rhodococcus sp. 06-621-2]|nr:cytochrome P450 [Rhodococcus sp. 06-621-2]OZC56071.1 cytochrome P450 [Rhodococcus sp. 06-621-2]OZD69116.1 cytochrome P450 [Rhodococcus sp. 06-1059B-a]